MRLGMYVSPRVKILGAGDFFSSTFGRPTVVKRQGQLELAIERITPCATRNGYDSFPEFVDAWIFCRSCSVCFAVKTLTGAPSKVDPQPLASGVMKIVGVGLWDSPNRGLGLTNGSTFGASPRNATLSMDLE